MNGNNIFLDTNIILYLLNGDDTLATFLNNKNLFISIITELELLAFDGITKKDEKIIRDFLSECKILDINSEIKEETIKIRKKYKTKLPDSIIIASAIYHNLPLISADFQFKKVNELLFVYYEK
jgi:predicted nucleic acid-binding protein